MITPDNSRGIMEPPMKRQRTGSTMAHPSHMYTQRSHEGLRMKLKSTFESIFEKYGKDFTGVGDEVDLETGRIIVDNGHLIRMQDEHDEGVRLEGLHSGHQSPYDGDYSADEEDIADELSADPATSYERNALDDMDAKELFNKIITNPESAAFPSTTAWAEAGSKGIDPLWDAPDIPGLYDAAIPRLHLPDSDEDVTSRRSESPYRSLWEPEFAQEDSRIQRFRWTAKEEELLQHLRTTTSLTYRELCSYFPGRSAAQLQARWWRMSHDLGSRNNIQKISRKESEGIGELAENKASSRTQQKGPPNIEIEDIAGTEKEDETEAKGADTVKRSNSRLPWNAEEENLLKHLRTTTAITYKDLVKYFPSRSISSLVTRWSMIMHQPPMGDEISELVGDKRLNSKSIQPANVLRKQETETGLPSGISNFSTKLLNSWTREEDLLLRCLQVNATDDWNHLEQSFPGRTANAIKLRWYSLIAQSDVAEGLVEQKSCRRQKRSLTPRARKPNDAERALPSPNDSRATTMFSPSRSPNSSFPKLLEREDRQPWLYMGHPSVEVEVLIESSESVPHTVSEANTSKEDFGSGCLTSTNYSGQPFRRLGSHSDTILNRTGKKLSHKNNRAFDQNVIRQVNPKGRDENRLSASAEGSEPTRLSTTPDRYHHSLKSEILGQISSKRSNQESPLDPWTGEQTTKLKEMMLKYHCFAICPNPSRNHIGLAKLEAIGKELQTSFPTIWDGHESTHRFHGELSRRIDQARPDLAQSGMIIKGNRGWKLNRSADQASNVRSNHSTEDIPVKGQSSPSHIRASADCIPDSSEEAMKQAGLWVDDDQGHDKAECAEGNEKGCSAESGEANIQKNPLHRKDDNENSDWQSFAHSMEGTKSSITKDSFLKKKKQYSEDLAENSREESEDELKQVKHKMRFSHDRDQSYNTVDLTSSSPLPEISAATNISPTVSPLPTDVESNKYAEIQYGQSPETPDNYLSSGCRLTVQFSTKTKGSSSLKSYSHNRISTPAASSNRNDALQSQLLHVVDDGSGRARYQSPRRHTTKKVMSSQDSRRSLVSIVSDTSEDELVQAVSEISRPRFRNSLSFGSTSMSYTSTPIKKAISTKDESPRCGLQGRKCFRNFCVRCNYN